MKIKIVSSSLAFALTFVFSGLVFLPLTSKVERIIFNSKPNVETQNRISEFLRRDSENRKVKFDKLLNRGHDSDPANFIAPVVEYAAKTENMNLSGLPEDFQIAWLRYARATSESADLIKNLKSLPRQAILDEEEKRLADIKFPAESGARENLLSVASYYGVNVQE